MTIHLGNFPSEGSELSRDRPEIHDILCAPQRLQSIGVDDNDQIAELLMRCEQCSLPYGPGIQFAVSHDDEDALVAPLSPATDGQPDAYGQAMSERSGCHFHTGQMGMRETVQTTAVCEVTSQVLLL